MSRIYFKLIIYMKKNIQKLVLYLEVISCSGGCSEHNSRRFFSNSILIHCHHIHFIRRRTKIKNALRKKNIFFIIFRCLYVVLYNRDKTHTFPIFINNLYTKKLSLSLWNGKNSKNILLFLWIIIEFLNRITVPLNIGNRKRLNS